MTTVAAPNVHALAIDGTFDDCQDLVKAMFADAALPRRARLSAVNSINWARIVAQIVYYVAAALALGAPDRPVAFTVPTGNFGNVLPAYVARRMGLPIERLVIGTNANDILAPLLRDRRDDDRRPVMPTSSPSHGHPGLQQLRAAAVRAAWTATAEPRSPPMARFPRRAAR